MSLVLQENVSVTSHIMCAECRVMNTKKDMQRVFLYGLLLLPTLQESMSNVIKGGVARISRAT